MNFKKLTFVNKTLSEIFNNNIWLFGFFLFLLFSVTIDGFSTRENYINILYHSVFIGILAIAETYVLLAKRIDLSIESTAAFSGIITVWLCSNSLYSSGLKLPIWFSLIFVIGFGLLIGLITGFLVVRLKVNSFLVTLASYLFIRALANEITQGHTLTGLPSTFLFVSEPTIFNIPLMVFIMLGLFAFFEYILRFTVFGKHLYVLGENKNMAAKMGINEAKISYSVFIIAGILASIAGWLIVAKEDGASVFIAQNYIFEVFVAVLIGRISVNGGKGNLIDVLAGCLILSMIKIVFVIYAFSPYFTDIFIGILIIIIASINAISERKNASVFYKKEQS